MELNNISAWQNKAATSRSVDNFLSQLKRLVKSERKEISRKGLPASPSHDLFLHKIALAAGYSSWRYMRTRLLEKNALLGAEERYLLEEDEKHILKTIRPYFVHSWESFARVVALNWCKDVDIYHEEISDRFPRQKTGKSPLTPSLNNYLKMFFPETVADQTVFNLEQEFHWIEEDLIFDEWVGYGD